MSHHFESSIFSSMDPFTKEYYDRVRPSIFEKKLDLSEIEVRCMTRCMVDDFRVVNETIGNEKTSPPTPEFVAPKTPNVDSRIIHVPCQLCSKMIKSTISVSSEHTCDAKPKQESNAALNKPDRDSWEVVDLKRTKICEFVQATRHDCRFIYLRQRNSYSRIKITEEEFECLVGACGVFSKFRSFMVGFRVTNFETEIGPPAMEYSLLKAAESTHINGYECVYTVRYVEFTNRPEKKNPWSVRKFTLYHKYRNDPSDWYSTWMLVGASQRTEKCLEDYRRGVESLKTVNPLELHVLFIDAAIASWTPYVADLTKEVATLTAKAAMMIIGDPKHPDNFVTINVEHYQKLAEIETKMNDVALCLDSTADSLDTLRRMSNALETARPCEAEPGEDSRDSSLIYLALREKERSVAHIRRKSVALSSKIKNARELISSLLELQNGYNLDHQMIALQNIEKESSEENAIMRKLAEKSSRESSSVRILTVITLIYLPCTVVSSFYSTQFVDKKEVADDVFSVVYTQNAWLFFAVSVPLTLLTLMVWYTWVHFRTMLRACSTRRHRPTVSLSLQPRLPYLRKPKSTLPT